MPVWVVTGGSGFLGRHLLADLSVNRREGTSIVAVGRRCPTDWARSAFRQLDLEDRSAVSDLLAELTPDCVLHLAGKTPPGSAEEFDRLNTSVTIGLIDALIEQGIARRLVLVGSAAELGPVPVEELPVGEDYPCGPLEPYGQSKWRATLAGLAASPPLEVVVARVFNPIGPGLPGSQALGRFAALLAGGSGPLRLTVGDLDARRDFVDVRDVASALILLAEFGQAGQVYHLGTGQSHSVRDGLERLIDWSGREVTLEVDPALARSRGPADSRADVRKVFEQTGWTPKFAWDQSLIDLWTEAAGCRNASVVFLHAAMRVFGRA